MDVELLPPVDGEHKPEICVARVRVRVSYRVRCGYGGTLILNILGYGYGNIYNIFLNKNKYIIHKK
jgi:hypothetical protein